MLKVYMVKKSGAQILYNISVKEPSPKLRKNEFLSFFTRSQKNVSNDKTLISNLSRKKQIQSHLSR